MFTLSEHQGDLFADGPGGPTGADALVLNISADLKSARAARCVLEQQVPVAGRVLRLTLSGRPAFYLVTRNKRADRGTYVCMARALLALRLLVLESAGAVRSLAMLRVGCGRHGRLEWPRVKAMIIQVLGDLPLTISVYCLS